MNIKAILIVGALIMVVGAVYAAFRWMGRPLYNPGDAQALLKGSSPLDPGPLIPSVEVEPGVELYTFIDTALGEPGKEPPPPNPANPDAPGAHEGPDYPLAIVVPGGPGAAPVDRWSGLAPLARTHRVLYYHPRGSGRSSRVSFPKDGNYPANAKAADGAYGLARQVVDLERLRQRSGLEKVTLVGHSFGALVATLYATEFPNHVENLVLLAPAALLAFPNDENLFDKVAEILPDARRPAFKEFKKRYLDFSPGLFKKSEQELADLQEEFGQYYFAALGKRSWVMPPQEGPHAPSPQTVGPGWMVYGQYFSLGMHHDYRDAISSAPITAPTTVIHFGDDLQSPAVAREYAELISGATFHNVEKLGHFGMVREGSLDGVLKVVHR